jgi:hypothetical protein
MTWLWIVLGYAVFIALALIDGRLRGERRERRTHTGLPVDDESLTAAEKPEFIRLAMSFYDESAHQKNGEQPS